MVALLAQDTDKARCRDLIPAWFLKFTTGAVVGRAGCFRQCPAYQAENGNKRDEDSNGNKNECAAQGVTPFVRSNPLWQNRHQARVTLA
jgi:hypothetical protein